MTVLAATFYQRRRRNETSKLVSRCRKQPVWSEIFFIFFRYQGMSGTVSESSGAREATTDEQKLRSCVFWHEREFLDSPRIIFRCGMTSCLKGHLNIKCLLFFLLRFSVGIINGGCRRECHHPNLLPVKEKVAPTVNLLQLLCCPQIVCCASNNRLGHDTN